MCYPTDLGPLPEGNLVFFAVLVGVVSFVGAASNLLSFIVLNRHVVFRNSFGRLTSVHALANCGHLTAFGISTVIFILMDFSSNEILQRVNIYTGRWLLFCQEIALHACFVISLNRTICIGSPLIYRKYFTNRITTVLILFILVICGIYVSVFFHEDCEISFDRKSLSWSFSMTSCGDFLAFYIDFLYHFLLFIIIAIMDVTSLILMRVHRHKMIGHVDRETARRRRQRDIRFFSQTVAISLTFGLTLFSFDVLRCQLENVTQLFLTVTLGWCSAHTISGLILVAFNREIHSVIRFPLKMKKSSSGEQHSAKSTPDAHHTQQHLNLQQLPQTLQKRTNLTPL